MSSHPGGPAGDGPAGDGPTASGAAGPGPFERIRGARSAAVLTWGWLAVGGAVTIGLGLVSVLAPQVTVSFLAIVFSLWLLAAGMSRLVLAGVMARWPGWRRAVTALLGAVLAVAGIAGLVNVAGSERLLAAVIGVGFLVAAAADLLLASTGSRGRSRAATFALAALHVALAVVFLLLPEVGLTAVAVLVGAVLLLLGAAQLVAAAVIRRAAHRLIAAAEAAAAQQRRDGDGDGPRVIEGEVL